jgi:hypothetical protein
MSPFEEPYLVMPMRLPFATRWQLMRKQSVSISIFLPKLRVSKTDELHCVDNEMRDDRGLYTSRTGVRVGVTKPASVANITYETPPAA